MGRARLHAEMAHLKIGRDILKSSGVLGEGNDVRYAFIERNTASDRFRCCGISWGLAQAG
jgi:hypothetical protein